MSFDTRPKKPPFLVRRKWVGRVGTIGRFVSRAFQKKVRSLFRRWPRKTKATKERKNFSEILCAKVYKRNIVEQQVYAFASTSMIMTTTKAYSYPNSPFPPAAPSRVHCNLDTPSDIPRNLSRTAAREGERPSSPLFLRYTLLGGRGGGGNRSQGRI